MIKLTVIIPLYNREKYIGDCLKSIITQSDICDLHILVINDGSSDSSADIVKSIALEYPKITMVTTENGGVTKARNVGLSNIPKDCDIVSFIDSDDMWPKDRLSKDLKHLVEDDNLAFTYGYMLLADEFGDNLEPVIGSKQILVRGVSLSVGLFRRSLLNEVGKFDESFEQAEDLDYLLRAFESTANYKLVDTQCVYYRQHPGNMTKQTSVSQKSYIQALHRSIMRRRKNPNLKIPQGIFEIDNLRDANF